MPERMAPPSGIRHAATLDDVLVELAVAHRVLAREGLNFGTIGGVALRDPQGRGFWTKRSGIGMEEVYGPAELVMVDSAGNRLAGGGGPLFEWPLRPAIFRARSDVNAIVYARPSMPRSFPPPAGRCCRSAARAAISISTCRILPCGPAASPTRRCASRWR